MGLHKDIYRAFEPHMYEDVMSYIEKKKNNPDAQFVITSKNTKELTEIISRCESLCAHIPEIWDELVLELVRLDQYVVLSRTDIVWTKELIMKALAIRPPFIEHFEDHDEDMCMFLIEKGYTTWTHFNIMTEPMKRALMGKGILVEATILSEDESHWFLEKNYQNFVYFVNQYESVSRRALERSPILYEHIYNPSREITLLFVKTYRYAIPMVKNPDQDLIILSIKTFNNVELANKYDVPRCLLEDIARKDPWSIVHNCNKDYELCMIAFESNPGIGREFPKEYMTQEMYRRTLDKCFVDVPEEMRDDDIINKMLEKNNFAGFLTLENVPEDHIRNSIRLHMITNMLQSEHARDKSRTYQKTAEICVEIKPTSVKHVAQEKCTDYFSIVKKAVSLDVSTRSLCFDLTNKQNKELDNMLIPFIDEHPELVTHMLDRPEHLLKKYAMLNSHTFGYRLHLFSDREIIDFLEASDRPVYLFDYKRFKNIEVFEAAIKSKMKDYV